MLIDDMKALMEPDIKLQSPIVPELFITGRKLNVTLVFMSQFCFKIPTNIRTNVTHYHGELQQIALNHISNMNLKIS